MQVSFVGLAIMELLITCGRVRLSPLSLIQNGGVDESDLCGGGFSMFHQCVSYRFPVAVCQFHSPESNMLLKLQYQDNFCKRYAYKTTVWLSRRPSYRAT